MISRVFVHTHTLREWSYYANSSLAQSSKSTNDSCTCFKCESEFSILIYLYINLHLKYTSIFVLHLLFVVVARKMTNLHATNGISMEYPISGTHHSVRFSCNRHVAHRLIKTKQRKSGWKMCALFDLNAHCFMASLTPSRSHSYFVAHPSLPSHCNYWVSTSLFNWWIGANCARISCIMIDTFARCSAMLMCI